MELMLGKWEGSLDTHQALFTPTGPSLHMALITSHVGDTGRSCDSLKVQIQHKVWYLGYFLALVCFYSWFSLGYF